MKRQQIFLGMWCFLQMGMMQGMEVRQAAQVTDERSFQGLAVQEHHAYVRRLEKLVVLQAQTLVDRDAHIERQHAVIIRLQELLEAVKREDDVLDCALSKSGGNGLEGLSDGKQ